MGILAQTAFAGDFYFDKRSSYENGKYVLVDRNGKRIKKSGWVAAKAYPDPYAGSNFKSWTVWYYLNSSGVVQTGWKKSGGRWYRFNSKGVLIR